MPELPEVETIRQGLQDLIVGYKITGMETDSPKQVVPNLGLVNAAIQGSTLLRVARRAKIILLFLDNGKILAIHLKLTGRLLVRSAGAASDEWQHVTIKLKKIKCHSEASAEESHEILHFVQDDTGTDLELRFCDARKFGWIKLLSGLSNLSDLGTYGPEPFDCARGKPFPNPAFNVNYLREIFSKTDKPVKVVIMDQEKISGIGNIYANDALFLAGIDPRRPAKSLKNEETEKLKNAIETVLKLGLKDGGASDQYYLNAKGEKGAYQNHFLVYGLQGKPCQNHCGGIIKRVVVGGRGTFFCPACQR